jgi:dTDP-4-dehydrorhamnose reductase
MRLLVTGGGGMLARDVGRAAQAAGDEPILLSRRELDITDRRACDAALANLRPGAVINTAAWTDVDGAQDDPAGATAVNGTGAGNVAAAAAQHGARIVHLSSDYVFDGEKLAAYVESDAPNPLSAYGESKLAGEIAVARAAADHAIVRSSWLFGAGGRNFVATMLELAETRDEVTVVADQVGCPTYTAHLAPALVALARSHATGTFHVAAGGACAWSELARATFAAAGVECRVVDGTTAALGRPAPRPRFSALMSERGDAPLLPEWTEGLRAYLAELATGAIA